MRSVARPTRFPALFPALALAGALVAGQALAVGTQNPPPAQKLEGYAGYEIRPIAITPELGDKKNADKVVAKLEEHVAAKVQPMLDGWNEKAAGGAASTEKLVLEPRITALHKPSGATRFFAGAFAGDGRILIQMRIVEAGSGRVIAEPEFYRRANAVVGAWSVGGHDNAMLEKVIGLIAIYLNSNYTEALGGATGYEP